MSAKSIAIYLNTMYLRAFLPNFCTIRNNAWILEFLSNMTSKTTNWNEVGFFVAGGVTAIAGIAAYRAYTSRIVKKNVLQGAAWKVGQNQPLPFRSGSWKGYSFDELKASGGAYSLLISSVVPRPIALVSSQSAAGAVNCAPFSYFNAVSHDPPLIVLGITINGRTGTKKDSLRNIEETGTIG